MNQAHDLACQSPLRAHLGQQCLGMEVPQLFYARLPFCDVSCRGRHGLALNQTPSVSLLLSVDGAFPRLSRWQIKTCGNRFRLDCCAAREYGCVSGVWPAASGGLVIPTLPFFLTITKSGVEASMDTVDRLRSTSCL